ncbi:NUP159 [Candida theae]|uniref:NUP159 n=1 Tax=Candida theae TaxID=1198502 RepID=A0AAD5G149_9ASCO|nr:NUP159 [Candida theae]KAI5968940.1 NUP159 [Candida theae]
MDNIDEVVSDDYGFKLIDDIPVTEAIDLSNHKDGEELRLLAIHDEHRIIAVSNSNSLKFVSADNLDDVDEVNGDFAITQLYFTDSKFYMLNNKGIQTLTIEQIKQKDYQFESVEGQYTNLKPLDDENYLAYDKGTLYHNSTQVASNVTKFEWQKSSPVYITKSDQFQIMGKPIDFDDAAKSELSHSRPAELISFKDYIFIVYDSSEEQPSDDHQIRTFLLKLQNEKYTPFDIEIASPYCSACRTTTYYTATITNWVESTQINFITSSLSTEIGILNTSDLQQPVAIVPAEDSNQANYPMDEETLRDVSPVGFAISVHELKTQVKSPCVGVEGEVVGKLPKIYALLDNGNLRSWWVFNKSGILNDELSLERAVAANDSNAVTLAANGDATAGDKEATVSGKAAMQANPFQTTSNPFGSSTAGAFKSPVVATKVDNTSESAKSAFGSTGFGSNQSKGSAFGSTGFGSSSSASPGFGSAGFGSSSFSTATKDTTSPAKSTLSSGFGKFSNQQPATFGNTASGQNIFGNETKASSPFGQSSNTSSPFGKSENKPTSLFNSKEPNSSSVSKPASSPFAALGGSKKTEGIDNNRPTPFADPLDSSKEPTPAPSGSAPFGESNSSKQTDDKPTSQAKSSPFGKKEGDDLSFAFGGLNTKEKSKEPFGSSFSSFKKSDTPSPFASLKKPDATSPFSFKKPDENSPFGPLKKSDEHSPFSNLNPTKAPSGEDKEKHHNDNTEELVNENEPLANDTSSANTPDEDVSNKKETHYGSLQEIKDDEDDSSNGFEATDNNELSQDDEEDEVDDQQFVDESEKNDSSWVNISKKDAEGRVLAQTLVDLQHDGASKDVKDWELIIDEKKPVDEPANEPADEPADEPIEPVEFLVFDGFSGSLEKSDDPIANKMRTVIANTEGNLQFLAKNLSAVTGYIDAHSTPGKHWHEITEVGNLDYDKDKYKGKLHYLHEKETELNKLNSAMQQSQNELRTLDKSFSQLALLEKGSKKNLKFLKNRPLEPTKQETRERLRSKLANVQSLESRLRTSLMHIKARSSLNLSTVDKIEQILSQLNDQVLDRKITLSELEDEMKALNLEGSSKRLAVGPGAAKLELRKRLQEKNSKYITK